MLNFDGNAHEDVKCEQTHIFLRRPKDKAGTIIRFLLYQEHEVTHVGVGKDREFSCDKCGKMLTSAQSLTYHLYTHEGRRCSVFKTFQLNGLFTLLETDSGTNSDSDSKPDCYIVLYRNCSNCTDLDLDPNSLFFVEDRCPSLSLYLRSVSEP